MRCCVPILVLLLACVPGRSPARDRHVPSGIDHANIAVADLDAARELFEKLGFSIKPGQPHKNSIANVHLKFTDGTELELITASEPRDSLAAEYLRYARDGDGGAFVALRVVSVDTLAAWLRSAGFPVRLSRSTGMRALVFPEMHRLRPLWLLEFLRPYRDRPEYTTHRNGAQRLRAVWLGSIPGGEIELLLATLEIDSALRDAPLPGCRVFDLGSSEIYGIPLQEPLREPGRRPFTGATFEVDRIETTATVLRSQGVAFTRHEDARGVSLRLTLPSLAGFVVEFLQPHEPQPREASPRDVDPRERSPE